jgi:SAM-dependent methyltransferase
VSPLDSATTRHQAKIRADLQVIADMVAPESRVLDIGCADGALLDHLLHHKQVVGRGIELSQAGVNACVSQGLSVIQGDADTDLTDYPPGAFDFVILSQTLQATRDPHHVLSQLVRIGRRAVVSFPNFGNWQVRLSLLTWGRMPVTGTRRPTSTSARSAISWRWPGSWASPWSAPWPWTTGAARTASSTSGSPTCWASTACSC